MARNLRSSFWAVTDKGGVRFPFHHDIPGHRLLTVQWLVLDNVAESKYGTKASRLFVYRTAVLC